MPLPRPGDVDRRSVLRLGAAGTVLGLGGVAADLAAGPMRLAFAAPAKAAASDTLVVLSLRGGLDGLSMVPPLGDDAYAKARPTLAVPDSVAHRLDHTFGLHPALSPLATLWDAGRLAVVHAVGQLATTRSHTDAITAMEHAAPAATAGIPTGWVDRAVGVAPGAGSYAATQVGAPLLPQSMAGPHQNFALRTLDGVSLAVSETIVPVRGWQDALAALDAGHQDLDDDRLAPALASAPPLDGLAPTPAATESGYPAGGLGQALHDVARLVRANLGLRVATVEDTGWDLHSGLGTPQAGPMATKLGYLAKALLAFAKDLGPDLGRVVLVTLTEFGRCLAENGSGGLDHGHGTAMLVLGGGVKGKRVYGTWPGLDADALADGALAVTTDYRQVLAEILARRCGVTTTAAVFPGFPGAPLGLVDAR